MSTISTHTVTTTRARFKKFVIKAVLAAPMIGGVGFVLWLGPVAVMAALSIVAAIGTGEMYRQVYPAPSTSPRAFYDYLKAWLWDDSPPHLGGGYLRAWLWVGFIAILIGAGLPVLAWQIGPYYVWIASFSLAVGLSLYWRLMALSYGPLGFQVKAQPIDLLTAISSPAIFIGGTLGSFVPIAFAPHGIRWVITIFVLNVTSDVMSSLTGIISTGLLDWRRGKYRFNKLRPPFPHVSPSKTRTGFVGGGVATIMVGFVLAIVLGSPTNFWLGVAIAFSTPIGDLVGSACKRCVDTKDWSNMLGPHGGLMDRLDSFTFTAPVALFVLTAAGVLAH